MEETSRLRLELEIQRSPSGRVSVRVRDEESGEQSFESLESFYRYLVEKLRYRPGPGLG